MRPGQGAVAGAWGRAPLGANMGLWNMASQNSNFNNYNNVLGSSSRQNIMSHLVGKNPKWSQQNAAQRPQTKVKRLNQENGPRFNSFNTNVNKNKVKKYKSIEDKKYEDSVPREALYCHMCELGDFGLIGDYIIHLEGTNHSVMTDAFDSKYTANLELFRAEAKITSQRAIGKGSQNIKREIVFCNKCQCRVSGTLATHEKSPEHLQVINYLGVRCCGTSYNSRIELEEHWLSLQHIHYKTKLFAKYKDQGFTLQNEEENKQKLTAKATAEPHYDVSAWPSFDPTVPVGLRYVDIGASSKCRICCEYLEPLAVVILNHCSSSKHYQNMCIFFKELENNKTQISVVKNETAAQNKNQMEVKEFQSRKLQISVVKNETGTPNKNQTETKLPENSGKTKIPIKAESVPAVTASNDSSNTKNKSESNEADPEDDYGTVLDPSILLDESKNESLLEKSGLENEDKNDADEATKEDITEKVQEKDNSTNVEKNATEKQSSASSSVTNKLSVITEEECDACENGSSECKKHGDKRNNSEDLQVELGTPKKIRRTEEPVVATPPRRNSRRRSISEEPTIATPTRTSRRKSISEETTAPTTPSRTTRRRSISQI